MTCSICNGNFDCPVCGEDVLMITCPDCDGEGSYYFDQERYYIPRLEYLALPDHARSCEKCFKCHGWGEVENPTQYKYNR